MEAIRVTVWNEFRHEREKEAVAAIYPDGIHGAIAAGLQQQLGSSVVVRTATLDEPEHGLTSEVLDQTDVLMWWGHLAHDQVDDEIVKRVQHRVWEGMGLIVLHSGHASKIFQQLMGTGCMLRWREAGEQERLWIVAPSHPIVDGLDVEYFELPATEMYGEYFDIPAPDELVLISWFAGGEVFRSGCTFRRGKGKIFYFRPGHETYPIYHDSMVRRVLANAVRWAVPSGSPYQRSAREIPQPLNRW
ncbi:MAG: ThuA domain-containing protein [Pirellulales bacterium]